MTHHLVGTAEIAQMLGVSKQRANQLSASYPDFPTPEVELASGRIWSRGAIEAWMAAHPERPVGRPKGKGRGPMFQRFTDRARVAVTMAQEEARELNHHYVGTEHLLASLMTRREGLAFEVLTDLGVTADVVRERIVEMVGEGPEPPKGRIPFTPRAKKVLEIALREAIQLGHNYIGTEHVLLGVVREGEGVGAQILMGFGTPTEIRSAVLAKMRGTGPGMPIDVAKRLDEIVTRIEKLEREKEN